MVVIDVFAKIRGTTPPGLSAYDADYTAMGRAKNLADGVLHVTGRDVEEAEYAMAGTPPRPSYWSSAFPSER
jgi:hypothetical protein